MRRGARRALGATLAAGAAALPGAAFAQGLPDLGESVIVAGQIGAAGDAALGAALPPEAAGAGGIDGEAGIVVLTLNEIFRISASGSLGVAENPERSLDTLGTDGFGEAALTAGIVTRLAGTVDFALAGSIGGREFFDREIASNRNISGTLSLGTPIIGPLYAGVVAYGGWNYDRDFENAISFHGVGANLSAALPLGPGTALRPGLGINRQWSEVEENTSTTASASIELFQQFGRAITASARAAVSRRWFDDFYEDVTFVDRRDWTYGASATLAWRLSPGAALALTGGYERVDSSFFLATYEGFEAAATIGLSVTF